MNCLRSFALKAAALAVVAACAGCGRDDGSDSYAKGWTAYGARDLVKAERLFAKAVGCDPSNADMQISLARVRLELGNLDGAEAAVKAATTLASGDSDVKMLAAQLKYHRKDYDGAATAYAALASDANREVTVRAEAFAGLAVVDMTRNEFERARVSLLKALLFDRRNAAARYHLAVVYRDYFDFPEAALDQFEIYVRLSKMADLRVQKVQRSAIPDLKGLVARKIAERPGVGKRDCSGSAEKIAKAEIARKKGQHKEARQFYEAALKADPLAYPAALGLAVEWERTDTSAAGRRKALECYQNASSLKPCVTAPLLAAGRIALASGSIATAVAAYSRAVAAEPTNLEALDGFIRALRRSGSGSSATASEYSKYRDMVVAKRKHR